ncbi:MAG: hypothetical protein ACI915_001793 [Gammaproteobacteria bacterium]|jgi:hypothetical protein
MKPESFTTGNAIKEQKRGWFVGQFVAVEEGLRRQSDVELKWGVHRCDDQRHAGWAHNRIATTISILIDGIFVVQLRGEGWQEDIRLAQRGDYVIINAGVDHYWYAESDCTIVTIRTPSIADDQVHLP